MGTGMGKGNGRRAAAAAALVTLGLICVASAGPTLLPVDRARALAAVNALRERHGAPPVQWSAAAEQAIAGWVQGLAAKGAGLEHTPASRRAYGENLALIGLGGPGRPSDGTPAVLDALAMWYSEEPLYDYLGASFSAAAGHFTQLVWVGARAVGAAAAVGNGSSARVYVGMAFDPPGNVKGAFADNVLPYVPSRRPPAARPLPPPPPSSRRPPPKPCVCG